MTEEVGPLVELYDHEEVVRSFACDNCHKQFNSLKALRRHLKTHGNDTYECIQCSKTFKTKLGHDRHYKTVHCVTLKEHMCSYCGNWYKSRGSLTRHVTYNHKKCGKVCKVCKRNFRDNTALKKHLISHVDDVQECKLCCRLFKDVKTHIKNCSQKKRVRLFSCEYCGKKFLAKRYLADHINNKHIRPDSFLCSCGKVYSYRYSLKRHQKNCDNQQ